MALDGLVIHAIVHELQSCVGGKINKIHQPTEHDIIIQLRAQGSNKKLLLSANPTYPRVHTTQNSYMNPLEAPMFCMLMRKHCETGVIESIEQVGLERIIHIDVRQRDELGDTSVKRIVVELMGRHSNIILLDPSSGAVLDGIHHVTPAISSYRVVLPGSAYVAPPEQEKYNPLAITKETFVELLRKDAHGDTAAEETIAASIVRSLSGISPLIAREIVYRGGLSVDAKLKELHGEEHRIVSIGEAFAGTMRQIRSHEYEPAVIRQAETDKMFFHVLPILHITGERQAFRSVSECLEAFYGDKAERDTIKQRVSDLLRFLQNEKAKNIKKLEKLEETIEEAKNADRYRILGELLTASMHRIQRGDKQIEVVNYYDEEQKTLVIPLDPQLTPSENAQRYFKKYTKSKNSLTAAQEQVRSTREEIAYLESLLQQLDNASLADIDEIRDELTEQGYIRDRGKKNRKKKKPDKPALNCYTSSEGIPIYVGKNNTQNEYLTNRLAHPSDTWLHTKDIPGSHVVIRSASFGEKTLEEAAQLAAYFSQARASSRVPVDYTLIRHVRKPNGAKPGFVIYDHQKTLYVTPDEQLIKQLPVEVK